MIAIEEEFDLAANLPDPMQRLLMELMKNPNVAEAARAADVGVSTAYRYRKDPDFQAAHRQLRQQAIQDVIALLNMEMVAAVRTLAQIRDNPNAAPRDRSVASRAILESGFKAGQVDDYEELVDRVDRLTKELESYR
jgi:hypothetical protein